MMRTTSRLPTVIGSIVRNNQSTWPRPVQAALERSELVNITDSARNKQEEEDSIWRVYEIIESSDCAPYWELIGSFTDLHEANVYACKHFIFGGAWEAGVAQQQNENLEIELENGRLYIQIGTNPPVDELTTVLVLPFQVKEGFHPEHEANGGDHRQVKEEKTADTTAQRAVA